MIYEIPKYPRTHHLEGSRVPAGKVNPDAIPFSKIQGRHVVVEEKVDGSHAGVFFDGEAKLYRISRNTLLTGEGRRERHFRPFLNSTSAREEELYEVLGDRYVMYGEWAYAKHELPYNLLPDFFLETDVYDRETGTFLDTARRQALLWPVGVCSVEVLYEGLPSHLGDLTACVGPSGYHTGTNVLMEGLYIKVEEGGAVVERYKWVRHEFVDAIVEGGGHWVDRPLTPNLLISETVG